MSKLKLFHGQPPTQIPTLEMFVTGTLIELQPSGILDTLLVRTPMGNRRQFFIHGEGFPALKPNWEEEDQIRTNYLSFNLEDKVVFKGSGSDTMLEEASGSPEGNVKIGLNREELDRPKRNRKSPKWLEGFVKQ